MQLTATCDPLFKLLKKDAKIEWTDECEAAFDKIKQYLLNPPILVHPMPGHSLILYLAVQEASMGCMLGQLNECNQKEKAFTTWEDMLHPSVCLTQFTIVNAQLHHTIIFLHGPYQVHLWNACLPKEDLSLVDFALRIRYRVYDAKGHQGPSYSKLPSVGARGKCASEIGVAT